MTQVAKTPTTRKCADTPLSTDPVIRKVRALAQRLQRRPLDELTNGLALVALSVADRAQRRADLETLIALDALRDRLTEAASPKFSIAAGGEFERKVWGVERKPRMARSWLPVTSDKGVAA